MQAVRTPSLNYKDLPEYKFRPKNVDVNNRRIPCIVEAQPKLND